MTQQNKFKKIYYILNKTNNTILNWWTHKPINLPWDQEEDVQSMDIPEEITPVENFDKVINGQLIHDEAANKKAYEDMLKKLDITNQINTLKNELDSSDYKAIKHSEGLISDEDYEIIKQEREALRVQIRELQKQLDN